MCYTKNTQHKWHVSVHTSAFYHRNVSNNNVWGCAKGHVPAYVTLAHNYNYKDMQRRFCAIYNFVAQSEIFYRNLYIILNFEIIIILSCGQYIYLKKYIHEMTVLFIG